MKRVAKSLIGCLICLICIFGFVSKSQALTDGFESARFESNWTNAGTRKWRLTFNQDRIEGRYAAVTNSQAGENKTSILQTITNIQTAGNVSFFVKTESNSSLNTLRFFIDGEEKLNLSRSNDWKKYTYRLSAGTHTLRWTYNTSSSFSPGKALLDNVRGPNENFSVFNTVSSGDNCTIASNSVWVGDFKGPIPNLSKGNFSVFVGGERATDFNFRRLGNGAAVNAALVMDYSGSMSRVDISNAESAAIQFVSGMDGNDRSGVIKFASTVARVQTLTNSKGSLFNKILEAPNLGGSTAFYDGLIRGINELRPVSGEKVVVAYTDGFENNSSASLTQVINLARASGIRVFTVGLGAFVDEAELKFIAEQTGGLFLAAENSSQLVNLYDVIRSSIGGQYLISVKSPPSRDIEIKVNQSGQRSSVIKRFIGCPVLVPIYELIFDDSPPPPAPACQFNINRNQSVSRSLITACSSQNRTGRLARYFKFVLTSQRTVTIDVTSTDFDTYLYLLQGTNRTGNVLAFDDDSGVGRNSRITRSLSAGTYVIEATTFPTGTAGNLTATLSY